MFYIAGIVILAPFLLLWPWPWPDDLHIRTWPVFPRDIPDVGKWTTYIKDFKSYHLTHRHTWLKLYTTLLHGWSKSQTWEFSPHVNVWTLAHMFECRTGHHALFVLCCEWLQCCHYEEKLKTIQSNTNAVSPEERQQVTRWYFTSISSCQLTFVHWWKGAFWTNDFLPSLISS